MTKTKKQLRAEAVERLKNCVAARFDAESIVIALTSGRHGQSDWSLECDKLIDLLTDDEHECPSDPSEAGIACVDAFIAEHSNDVSAHESDVRTVSVDANDVKVSTMPLKMPSEIRWHYTDGGEYVQELTGDSREKLEADAFAYLQTAYITYPQIIKLLDRQAAITAEETSNVWEEYRDATQREIAELTAERDELKFDISLVRKNRDKYRKKFGKCLDYADAIHALMDEGMA